MAYNPFLSMNEPAAPVSADVLNPFMITDSEPSAFTGDNPFATSNPFSDFGGSYEPPAGDTLPVDIFGSGEPSCAKQFDDFSVNSASTFDIFGAPPNEERLIKPTELELTNTTADPTFSDDLGGPPMPPRPLPPETQNLILTVTGQMEFTSSHLLDRIPPTRTPSPVSVRDIHSPSPTPEPDMDLDPEPPVDSFDINRNKPTRPPPARPPPAARPPPPRPAPPPVPQPPQVPPPPQVPQQQPNAVTDDINLFDAPVPVVVKPTKEAILSLYSAPKKEEKPIDFLSDDILESVPAEKNEVVTALPDSYPPPMTTDVVSEKTTPLAPAPDLVGTLFSTSVNVSGDNVAPMDCSEPTSVATPAAMESSPLSDAVNDEFQNRRLSGVEKNPFEDAGIMNTTSSFPTETTNIFGVDSTNAFATNTNVLDSTQNNETNLAQASDMDFTQTDAFSAHHNDAFATNEYSKTEDAFMGTQETQHADPGWGDTSEAMVQDAFPESQDAFDAFSAKFDSTSANHFNTGAWGDEAASEQTPAGFEAEAFDPFLSMGAPPPPAATPRLDHQGSQDSADDTFSVFIRPKENEASGEEAAVPVLAPPPRPQALPESPRATFGDGGFQAPSAETRHQGMEDRRRSGSGGETPPTPLFDEDVSVPLEDFPRTVYKGPGWEMQLRQPIKKKITGQRFWKKVFVRVGTQGDTPVLQLLNAAGDKEPFQELPLQACYSVSDIAAQQFDQFGKIFTVKLQYIFYKERPGVRPGQVRKAERITNKLSQFAAYAIQGDYQGVKEFGSDLKKLGLPVEHAPQVSQLFKLGSLSYEDVKQFSCCVEEALFRLSAHRDRALYKMEEVQITAVDELYVEQDAEGSVLKQIARVRLFFLGFLCGMPDVEIGVNDLRRQGKEVVGRHDIIPVVTEEWIRVENQEFHDCVQPDEFNNTQIIKFKPPDACYIELMRFRVRPPKNRELPLQLKASWCVTGNKVELRADVLVPGFASRKLGQVPCEDVAIRFPIPECWIYLFRVEKHFRYGSVKSAHRRTGKVKGIERFLGAIDTLQESLIEVTSGQAKYEHQHRAIVWRMPRLPKEGQGAYTTHNLVCRMALTSYDQIPAELAKHAFVEFTMPATAVSHVTVRSVSLQEHDGDPPEKYVRYLARHEYIVGIERTSGQSAPAYAVAARADAPPAAPAAPPAPARATPQPPSSDSDSD